MVSTIDVLFNEVLEKAFQSDCPRHACVAKILSVGGNALVSALLSEKILFEPCFGLG
jgi:hypothetical protein